MDSPQARIRRRRGPWRRGWPRSGEVGLGCPTWCSRRAAEPEAAMEGRAAPFLGGKGFSNTWRVVGRVIRDGSALAPCARSRELSMLKALAPVLVLTSIALLVGLGLCLFDGHDAAGRDLCLSFLAATIGLFAALSLTPMGRLLPAAGTAGHRSPPDLPP